MNDIEPGVLPDFTSNLLDIPVWANLTLLDVLLITLAVLVGVMVLRYISKRKNGPPTHTELAHCETCGWSGTKGRYSGTCPRCNGQLSVL